MFLLTMPVPGEQKKVEMDCTKRRECHGEIIYTVVDT